MAFGFTVRVEYDLFARHAARLAACVHLRRIPVVRAVDRHAALHRILFALLRAGEIPVVVHARRHRHVGLLHVGFELLEQGVAQRRQWLVAFLAQAVLRRHVVADILRLLVPHPLVGVDERIAVMFPPERHLLRHRHVSVPAFGHSRLLYRSPTAMPWRRNPPAPPACPIPTVRYAWPDTGAWFSSGSRPSCRRIPARR